MPQIQDLKVTYLAASNWNFFLLDVDQELLYDCTTPNHMLHLDRVLFLTQLFSQIVD